MLRIACLHCDARMEGTDPEVRAQLARHYEVECLTKMAFRVLASPTLAS